MSQLDDQFAGVFDHVEPEDFTDPAALSAKLSGVRAALEGAGFDHEAFVDRCVRRAEATFYAAAGEPTSMAVLGCPDRDVTDLAGPDEILVDYVDRLHRLVVSLGACAAFIVAPSARREGAQTRATPGLYFYSESQAGNVIQGFWRITGTGSRARLTEFHKVRAAEPNRLMHRIMAGGD